MGARPEAGGKGKGRGIPVLLSRMGEPGAASARMPSRAVGSIPIGVTGPGFGSTSPHVRSDPRPRDAPGVMPKGVAISSGGGLMRCGRIVSA